MDENPHREIALAAAVLIAILIMATGFALTGCAPYRQISQRALAAHYCEVTVCETTGRTSPRHCRCMTAAHARSYLELRMARL